MSRKGFLAGYLKSAVFDRVGSGLVVLFCLVAIDSARSQGLFRTERLLGDSGVSMHLGSKVALGDLNGDGLADLIVEGDRTYIYYRHGNQFGTYGHADVEFPGGDFIVANVNGDAFKDLVMISPHTWINVYYGRNTAFTNGQPADWRWEAPYLGESPTGWTLGGFTDLGVLDVTGDGIDDIIVSSEDYKESMFDPGHYYLWGTAAYIFYGSASGMPADHSPDAILKDSDEAGEFMIQPEGPLSDPWSVQVSYWLSAFKEVSRDGTIVSSGNHFDQFAIGAPGTAIDINNDGVVATSEKNYGVVYVGPRSQLLYGDKAYYSQFGSNLGSAGDVNGDGLNDLLARDLGTVTLGRGPKAFLYLGKSDEYMTVVKRDYSWSVAVDRSGNPYTSEFGITMGSVGDINGDGFGDILITDPRYDNIGGRSQAEVGWWGGAFIWYGGPSTADNPSGLGAGGSPASCDIRLPSYSDAGNCGDFGRSYACGDINGDGLSDVVVGAPRWAYGGGNNIEIGAVFVYLSSYGIDLTSSPSWSPHSPNTRDVVTLRASIRNAGARESGACKLDFYVGPTEQAGQNLFDVPGLAPGGSFTVERQMTFPQQGTYSVTTRVDVDNVVPEFDESNNAKAYGLVVVPAGDLAPISIQKAGTDVIVTWPTPPSGGAMNLQTAPSPIGPWTDIIPAPTSPYTTPISTEPLYFRTKWTSP